MSLTISNYNKFFKMKGVLNRDTLYVFHEEFSHVFRKMDSVTINIEEIISMDRYGVNAIAELHTQALLNNKKLAIIGFGCKDLYDHFKSVAA